MLRLLNSDSPLPRAAVVVFAIVAAIGTVLTAQQQPTFKSATRTVPLYVTVTDADGRLVPDLTRDQFEVLDNGKPQPITVFANEIQDITVVVMLDRSRSVTEHFELVQEAARHFVRQLTPEDKAKIGNFSFRVQVAPDTFTSDHDELIQIIDSGLQKQAGPTPLWNAIAAAMNALWGEEGRRVVLVFTDGADAPANNFGTNSSQKDIIERSREEDVMVYGIGLTGRVPTAGPPLRPGMGGFGGGWGGGSVQQQPDKGLAKVAGESGGGYFEMESATDLAAAFARVAEELHRQYVIGFTPAALDGKTHKLDVRVKQAGMQARARKSYVASPEGR